MNTLDTGMTLNRAHAPAQLLLVDDDPLLRRMAARTLGHAGFEVVEAGDGEEALLRFAEHPADLVLLDLEMPGLGGHVVCERIRAMPLGARVPILILTGRNDTESIELAYQHGATDFITKPINWLLLSHRVRYALRASRAAEAVLRNQESTARAQRLAHLGSWFAHTDGRVDSSTELMRLYGAVPGTRWGARDFIARVVHADRRRVLQARRALAHDGTAYQAEFGVQRLDGCLRRMFEQATPVVDELGRVQGFEGITQDITDRVQAAERIRQLALFDEVTGLPNRRHFIELSAPLLDRARRNGHVCAVMHVNIDRFVGINDALGRVQGDAVLRLIAQRLRGWIRGSDLTGVGAAEQGVLARFGGSTFTLLIDDLTGQEQAASVAQRLVDAIAEPIGIEARSLVLAASIGIALFPCDAQDAAGLVGCAEQALHAARDAGGRQHRFFDEEINRSAASRLLRETELRQAIEAGQLRLHFQPKVDAASGAWVGAEALVRWQHPERGLVPPNLFIPLAEESGLILPLTDWVLETACRSLRQWFDAGLRCPPLSVNLAPPTFADPELPDRLDALMARFGLRPASLVLEITETTLMNDAGSVVDRLHALRSRGYAISLDDFGTGYSSLGYLRRFPIDELKIDRAFVTDVALGGADSALATAIIALAGGLGLKVVAEGVETRAQADFLLRQGCRVQQGYLFSRPLPADVFRQGLCAAQPAPATLPALTPV